MEKLKYLGLVISVRRTEHWPEKISATSVARWRRSESLVLFIKNGDLMWLGHLSRMLPDISNLQEMLAKICISREFMHIGWHWTVSASLWKTWRWWQGVAIVA